jgi:hypothetical protein
MQYGRKCACNVTPRGTLNFALVTRNVNRVYVAPYYFTLTVSSASLDLPFFLCLTGKGRDFNIKARRYFKRSLLFLSDKFQ